MTTKKLFLSESRLNGLCYVEDDQGVVQGSFENEAEALDFIESKKPKAKKSDTKLKAKLSDGNWYDVTCQGHAMEIAHAKGLNVLRIE